LNRALLLPSVWLLDQLAGDPEWLPHPVRLIGLAIKRGEAAIRQPGHGNCYDLLSGAAMTTVVVGAVYGITDQAILLAGRRSRALGSAVELLLGWTCVAARSLEQEASRVVDALAQGDLPCARRQLSRIVGRDTGDLQESDICRAVIETVAESACDGILAPIFFMALGGVPLAMAYKAVNTLDSMIGHADERYFYFGKAAARLDDAANYAPARITAAAIVAASALSEQADCRSAWSTWLRDGREHKSPNAGQPESAMAGALRVRLGGPNAYAGERIDSPFIGREFPPPTLEQARRTIQLVSLATVLGIAAGCILLSLRRRFR
jgi:adenosylcobinamide-phosphate synthase